MGYLRLLLEKTDLKGDDSLKKAFMKGMVEGALDVLVIVGTVQTITSIIEKFEK